MKQKLYTFAALTAWASVFALAWAIALELVTWWLGGVMLLVFLMVSTYMTQNVAKEGRRPMLDYVETLEDRVRSTAAYADMLAALRNLENDDGAIPEHAWSKVQDAIAKAERETYVETRGPHGFMCWHDYDEPREGLGGSSAMHMRDDMGAMLDEVVLREALASEQHEIWAHWMEYLFLKCDQDPAGNAIIPADLVRRWERQLRTPYQGLSEQEKDSDREQADRIIEVLRDVVVALRWRDDGADLVYPENL